MDYPYCLIYVNDMLSDPLLAQLSLEHEAIYHRLFWKSWAAGERGLPSDDKILARIVGVDVRKWRSFVHAIAHADLLMIENDRLFHRTVITRMVKMKDFSEKQSQNSRKRWSNNDH